MRRFRHLWIPFALGFACGTSPDKTESGETDPQETDADTDDSDTDDTQETDTAPPDGDPVQDISVEVHPDVATLLRVTWSQERAADATWLEFTFENDEWISSPEKALPRGAASEYILGVPAQTTVTFRVCSRIDDELWTSADLTGTTGSLPLDLPLPSLIMYDPLLASPERWMLGSVDTSKVTFHGPFYSFILDRQGRCVWYWPVPDGRSSVFNQIAADGGYLLLDGSVTWALDDSLRPAIFSLTLDLSLWSELTLGNYVFAFDEIPGGGILYDHKLNTKTARQFELRELSPDGTDRLIWNCDEYFASIGFIPELCMANAVNWVSGTDTILWSLYDNDCFTVVEIDRLSGEVLRYYGQIDGGWDIVPEEAMFALQHYPIVTDQGTLLVSTHATGDGENQYAREYAFNEASQTLEEIWSYKSEGMYIPYFGEALRTSSGNTILGYGSIGALREVTSTGETAWELSWPIEQLLGHVTLLDDLYDINQGPPAKQSPNP